MLRRLISVHELPMVVYAGVTGDLRSVGWLGRETGHNCRDAGNNFGLTLLRRICVLVFCSAWLTGATTTVGFACGPVQTAEVLSKDDPITAALAEEQTKIEAKYEVYKFAQPKFESWRRIRSPFAGKLFPKLEFAFITWVEVPHPQAKQRAIGLALGLGQTVAVDHETRQIVWRESLHGNYRDFAKLLVDHQITLQNVADAKRIWDAFCDIHRREWKNHELKKVSSSEWRLGINSYDQTTAVKQGHKVVVTRTHYFQIQTDPKTGLIRGWESKVETSNERKVPIDR